LKWIVNCVLEHNNITTNFRFLLIFCASKAIYGFHHELFYLQVLYAIKQKAIIFIMNCFIYKCYMLSNKRQLIIITLLKWIENCILDHNNINFSLLLIFCAPKALYVFHHRLFYLWVLCDINQKIVPCFGWFSL
jgi:hypothetical protein